MRKPYKTDLTDAQWEAIKPLIPPAKPGGRPREVDMREVLNTLLYQARSVEALAMHFKWANLAIWAIQGQRRWPCTSEARRRSTSGRVTILPCSLRCSRLPACPSTPEQDRCRSRTQEVSLSAPWLFNNR